MLAIPGSTLGSIPGTSPLIVGCIAESAAAVQIQDEANQRWALLRQSFETEIPMVLTIPILVWSDKAEKTKRLRNRDEVWHMTTSIHPSRHDTNTHYLSTGLSKANCDEVISRLTAERKELQLPTSGGTISELRVFVAPKQTLAL